ncbi:MAG TPA: DUF1254 domain-containing protein [Bryobacteraceae bacterium]|jgi:hypothetical protein|nr:DUF1254 domain-containing protein [Bryobacteraceae bacterium]
MSKGKSRSFGSTRDCESAVAAASCSKSDSASPAASAEPPDVRAIAKEAYIYAFPMVDNYQTLYKQAVDTSSHDYRAPFNVLSNASTVATPEDKFVVTPNSDTPYSYLWMDLRAEPMVVTMPKIENNRYYTGQLVDLYTFNFAYLGTRSYGNDGGKFLIAGPNWSGPTPAGIKAVLHAQTQFAYLLIRTQLFNAADIVNVRKIQSGYHAEPLSTFLHQAGPQPAPAVNWPKPSPQMLTTTAIFPYLNFLLQFCPTDPTETRLMNRFAKLRLGAGKTFDLASFSPPTQQLITDGVADTKADVEIVMKRINADQVQSSDFFGTREFLKNNYLYRFMGAKVGLYGNSGADAAYFGFFVDADHRPLDASSKNYELHFAKGAIPEYHAFWSLTMYDGKSQLLVANPIHRYLLNSTTLESYKYGSDGSLTFYVQKDSPGKQKESNWLPAPDGPFYAVFRVYMPGEAVLNGTWKKPLMQARPKDINRRP